MAEQPKLKLAVQLDPVEKIHRTEVRRARALHYLQRRALDSDITHPKRVEEALQLAQEELARLKDELTKVQPETQAASIAMAKVERAEAEVASLSASFTKANAIATARKKQRRHLIAKQETEDVKINNDFTAHMAGRDLEMTAPVLKLKVQGVTIPVKDEALPPLVETVKAALAEADRKQEEVAAGSSSAVMTGMGSANWAADLAQQHIKTAAQTGKRAAAEAAVEDEDAAEVEEGAGASSSAALTAEQKADKDKKRSRKDRRTPEEDQKEASRVTASRYVAMKPCAHCGAHANRAQLQACGDCHRVFCGQGDRGPAEPRGQPCIDMVRCRCGSSQCYDCYLGSDSRTNGLWLHCAKCDNPMCPLEWTSKTANCEGCGENPLCKDCQPAHEAECPKTLGPGAGSSSGAGHKRGRYYEGSSDEDEEDESEEEDDE